MGTEIRLPRIYASTPGPRADWLYVCDASQRVGDTSVGSVNRGRFLRRITPLTPISKVEIGVAVSSGNICIAAYAHDPATGKPGARLASSGSVACPASGDREVALGATVLAEWLYLAADNTTATFHNAAGSVAAFVGATGRAAHQDSAFPAPTDGSAAVFSTGLNFLLIGKP